MYYDGLDPNHRIRLARLITALLKDMGFESSPLQTLFFLRVSPKWIVVETSIRFVTPSDPFWGLPIQVSVRSASRSTWSTLQPQVSSSKVVKRGTFEGILQRLVNRIEEARHKASQT